MKILAVGGGSGGHVTPVAAVIEQLATQLPADSLTVVFVCDRAFESQSKGIMATVSVPVKIKTITSGKLRRYAHISLWQHFAHISIVGKNVLDIFKVIIGFIQSLILIVRFKPDVVFAKGGFVCLPVGFAAWCLRRPLVIHDSDVRPGLTSRLLARFARVIATGFPLENYPYPLPKSHYIGVPIDQKYSPISEAQQAKYKNLMGVDTSQQLILAFGGGLGSTAINDAMASLAPTLNENIVVYNVTGKGNIERAKQKGGGIVNYRAEEFVYGLHGAMAAADLVITRASATALQELAGLKRATIAVPASQLGDQQLNAKLFKASNAVLVMHDDDLKDIDMLSATVNELMDSASRRRTLANALHAFAKPKAASDLAALIIAANNR